MRAEKYIITTTIQGKVRNRFWESKRPLKLLHPEQYRIEKLGSVVRISDRRSNARVAEFGPSDLETGAVLSLPGMHLGIRKAGHISVPFLSHQTKGTFGRVDPSALSEGAQLFVYSGVRRTMIASQGVTSAFVAYARSRPIAVVYRKNEELYWIKPLLEGVRLKFRGERPANGTVGEPWQLSKEQLISSTLIRGVYWWRFNLVQVPSIPESKKDDSVLIPGLFSNADQTWFRFFGIASAIFFSVLTLLIMQFYSKKQSLDNLLPQTAKVVLKAPEIIPLKPKALEKIVKPIPVAEVEKPKTVELKDEPKEIKKEQPAPVVVAKPNEKIAPALLSQKKSDTPGSKEKGKSQKVAGAQKTSNDDLQDFLGQLAGSGGKAGLPGLSGATTTRPDARGLFSGGNKELLSPTEIKPGAPGAGLNNKELKIGGGNLGSAGVGDGVGYAAGEYAKIEGQGGSLISLDKSSYTVDEGLTKEEVAAVIESHMAEVRACYEASLLKKDRLEGRIHYAFLIQPTGGVNRATPNNVTFPDQDVIQCIQQRILTWIFPKPRGGVTVNVNYPFVFRTLRR